MKEKRNIILTLLVSRSFDVSPGLMASQTTTMKCTTPNEPFLHYKFVLKKEWINMLLGAKQKGKNIELLHYIKSKYLPGKRKYPSPLR